MRFVATYRNTISEIENILGLSVSQIGEVFLACHWQLPNDYGKFILIQEEDDKCMYYLCFEYDRLIEYETTKGLYGFMDGPALIKNTEDIEQYGLRIYAQYKKIAENSKNGKTHPE